MLCRYRFSWSPKGVLMNLKAGAKWLENGQVRLSFILISRISSKL